MAAHRVQRQTHGQAPSSENQIQALRAELGAVKKKADRYVHLVGTLYEELDNLRQIICYNCKKKIVPSYDSEPVASSSNGLFPYRIQVSGQVEHPGLPPVLTTTEKGSPNTSIPITARQDQATSPALGHPGFMRDYPFMNFIRPPLQNQARAIILTPPQASSTIPKQPSPTSIESKHPAWRVSHNPKIQQALQIDLVKTFNRTSKVACVKFSPDGKYLAVGNQGGGKTCIYEVEKGLNTCSLIDRSLKNQPTVWSIEFSRDSKYMAIASSDSWIRLWEIARKRTRVAFTGHHLSASTICFSPDGRFLVACDGGSVCIWSVRGGSSKRLIHDAPNISLVTFSPDGRHIASVEAGGWLRICNARTGQLFDRWRAHAQSVHRVVFSPDGKGLVSAGEGNFVRYWDLSSLAVMKPARGQIAGIPGQRFPQIRKFDGHASWIRSVCFSPDSRWVATSSLDQTIRIWDPHTAKCQCILHGHDGAYARSVDFAPAGKYLAGGGGHQVSIWRFREV